MAWTDEDGSPRSEGLRTAGRGRNCSSGRPSIVNPYVTERMGLTRDAVASMI